MIKSYEEGLGILLPPRFLKIGIEPPAKRSAKKIW